MRKSDCCSSDLACFAFILSLFSVFSHLGTRTMSTRRLPPSPPSSASLLLRGERDRRERERERRKNSKTEESSGKKLFEERLSRPLSFLSLSLPPSLARDPSRSQTGHEHPPPSPSPLQRRGRANFFPITFPSSVKPPVQVRSRHPLQRDNKGRRPQGQPFLRGHPPDVLEGGRHGLVKPLAFFVGVGERKSFGKARRKGGGEKGGGGG